MSDLAGLNFDGVDGNSRYKIPVVIEESTPDNVVIIHKLDLSDSDYLEMRERVLMTELNWVRRKLGKNPKTCPKCGEELK